MINLTNTAAGTTVRIINDPDFAGRLAVVCLSEPFKRFSPYSGEPCFVWMIRIADGGRFNDRTMEINGDCLELA